jgi:hypothetical protein
VGIWESRADRVSSFKRGYRGRTKRSERPGAGKRVESIDREKQNEIRIWPKKMQRYGYHDRSPSPDQADMNVRTSNTSYRLLKCFYRKRVNSKCIPEKFDKSKFTLK